MGAINTGDENKAQFRLLLGGSQAYGEGRRRVESRDRNGAEPELSVCAHRRTRGRDGASACAHASEVVHLGELC